MSINIRGQKYDDHDAGPYKYTPAYSIDAIIKNIIMTTTLVAT